MWVHVNRVEWRGIAKREKRHDHVQFPLDELDIAVRCTDGPVCALHAYKLN